MQIRKTIMYTPFMSGVKNFEKLYIVPTEIDGNLVIGYNHKIGKHEDVKDYTLNFNVLRAHDLLISDYNNLAHEVIKALPKTETCPHWLRAWTDLCFWNGNDILYGEIAKLFIDMDYESVPYKMSEIGGQGNIRSKWDATIYLYGEYRYPHE